MNYIMQKRLDDAIAWLGEKCVLHPARRVPKGNYEVKTMRCNVAETFKRVQKQLNASIPEA
ncbi:MAG: hypothetical protein KDA57_21610 [Planctomycetales bacterium]|nr:hypothetical protein [Planctomycetales bacterium]